MDDESACHVWDAKNGNLSFRFSNLHDKNKVTAACFDFAGRRLITAGHDGSIKMWNFGNG